jgi:HK97 family phage prohead protease
MKEIRVSEIRAQKPTADGEKALILSGRPVVYDTPTLIHDINGSYIEVVKRGALDNADLEDVRLLVGHDTSKIPLARTPKTMSLKVDDLGLTFRAILPDTEAGREAYHAVERGDLKGMSYAFTVPKGGDSYDPESNIRTINRILKVYECSLTAFPAYESTTVSAESRDNRLFLCGLMQERRRAKILVNQILRERY